jgi:toxin CptA
MHGAPSVSYPVGRCRFAAILMGTAWAAGAAACGAWLWLVEAAVWQRALAIGLPALAAVLALRAMREPPQGALSWTGDGWRWMPEGQEARSGRVALALDLQRWLLVHWTGSGGAAWLWMERRQGPRDWDALRRAVYSRARTEAPGAPQPPTAKP